MENNNNNQPIFNENQSNNQTGNQPTSQQVFYCRYCGNKLDPNSRVCLHCGAPNQFYRYNQGTQPINPYYYQTNPVVQNEENRKHFSPLTIVGLALSLFFPFASLIVGIISLVFTLQQKEKRDSYWKSNLIMSIAIIVISLILTIYSLATINVELS